MKKSKSRKKLIIMISSVLIFTGVLVTACYLLVWGLSNAIINSAEEIKDLKNEWEEDFNPVDSLKNQILEISQDSANTSFNNKK